MKKIENINKPVMSKETESTLKNLTAQKIPGPDGVTGEFYQIFVKEITPTLLKLFKK